MGIFEQGETTQENIMTAAMGENQSVQEFSS